MAFLQLLALAVCALAFATGNIPNSVKKSSSEKRHPEPTSSVDEIINFCKTIPEETMQKLTASNMARRFHKLTESGRYMSREGQDLMKQMHGVMQEAHSRKTAGNFYSNQAQTVLKKATAMMEAKRKGDCAEIRKHYTISGIEFQSAEGKCNNLKNLEWGARNEPFRRFHPAEYGGDGFNKPTTIRDGDKLPGPRDISRKYHKSQNNADVDHSYFLMQWGQFLDHDITFTPTVESANCEDKNAANLNPDCIRIAIKPDDPQFGVGAGIFRRLFIPFTRSAPTFQLKYSPKMRYLIGDNRYLQREQFNQLTSTIDASNVYGADRKLMDRLRDKKDPALLITTTDKQGKSFLPFDIQDKPGCMGPVCFCSLAGDVRAAEQPFLTLVQALWMREHNRIVAILRRLNPGWSPDRLFFETRNIIKSIFQHITYDEYLPNLMGSYVFEALIGKYSGYNSTVNPGIFNEFAAAAFRMGHSQLHNTLARVDENYVLKSQITFRQGFFQPHRLLADGADATFDNYMRGLLARPSQQIDRFVTTELVNHLFEEVDKRGKPAGPGLDLAALNIQRGRDHGLASYFRVRSMVNSVLLRAKLKVRGPFIDRSKIKMLKNIYGKLSRIDLWVGGLSETPLEKLLLPISWHDGGQLGPTFAAILAEQFRCIRDGDRFFWLNEHVDPTFPGSRPVLTPAQRDAIKNTNLATFICNNANNPGTMKVQPQAFRFPQTYRNQLLRCDEVHKSAGSHCLDLSPWGPGKESCYDVLGSRICDFNKKYGLCKYIGKFCSKTCNICQSSSNRVDTKICFLNDISGWEHD